MEHTLGAPRRTYALGFTICLNPCFSGTYSRRDSCKTAAKVLNVLILVLVEHTLGEPFLTLVALPLRVLILVLVEHTLGEIDGHTIVHYNFVLILVLVEHTLGDD